MPTPYQFHAEQAGERLDAFLVRHTGETRRYLKSQILGGQVRINGEIGLKASRRLKLGDEVSAVLKPAVATEVEAIPGPLDILFEDAQLLVLNKAQGIAVHPAPSVKGPSLVNYLLHHLKGLKSFQESDPIRPGIVHRLDLGTSGVLVIAKDRRTHDALSKQFEKRTVQKEYQCLSWGQLPARGKIDFPIGRHPKDRKRMTRSEQGRPAFTTWETLAYYRPVSHLRLFPRTGRTHQLRVHLSETNFPIVNDLLYARRCAQGFKNQFTPEMHALLKDNPFPFLHATSLKITHPCTEQPLHFTAAPPPVFQKLLALLKEHDQTLKKDHTS